MRFLAIWICGWLVLASSVVAQESSTGNRQLHEFQRIQLESKFFAEGAGVGDFDRDGAADVVAGPWLYLGPDFSRRREIAPVQPLDIEGYSEEFFAFPFDVDGDGWLDVVRVGFPGNDGGWLQNPAGREGHWERHVTVSSIDNESPTLADLTGDGRPELVFHQSGRFGYAEIPTTNPQGPWRFRPISPPRGYERFNHGLGVGDVNGDGRADVLERNGWWEQPASGAADGEWKFHEFRFAEAGGAQMHAVDLDGDGDNDVVTSLAAHAYGLAWFEQVRQGNEISFVEHPIMGERPEQNDYGLAVAGLHALAVDDVDGDGAPDLITGKRFWAHSSHDPGALEPPVLHWYRTVRDGGLVRFVPYLIDDDSGVGVDVTVADVNADQLPDVVVSNKKGTFAFTHQIREVTPAQWQQAQPTPREKPVSPPVATAAPQEEASSASVASYPAVDPRGKELNLGFENGDLRDWTPSGEAFAGQPVRGDAVRKRRGDSVSGHAGEFWVGTYEAALDAPQGRLVSAPFPVTRPYASFLIGGGSHESTRVEIVSRETDQPIFVAHGEDREQMRQVTADLREVIGQEIYLQVIDEASFGWGHVNFDEFRFHDHRPTPPAPVPGPAATPRQDDYPYSKLAAEDAARAMKLPPGFRVHVCAAEPDVMQPIAMALDDRGRLWVAEAYEYPHRAPTPRGRDRLLVFEDADGDGKFEHRKVFAEGLNLVSGLEVGFGGVFVGAAPYLMFIPDRDGDDVPDAEPEILLDGWGYQDTHETLNAFIWGPDGWLYGCHGVFTHSRVGKPGAPDDRRTPINAGVWRYHPLRRTFEVFAEGTSNPWGVDFDDRGQAFITACVIPHLYHVIQGARYQRQAGAAFNPYTYDDLKTIADHLHYQGDNAWAGNDRSDAVGGGHAHAGAMIYLGGGWPAEYRGKLFMNNIHGQRLNVDSLHRRGSGFVGKHEPDFLLTQDRASQMINVRYGPDGQAYVIDWYDMQACHDPRAELHDRSNGRIYKVSYGAPAKSAPVDVAAMSDAQLVDQMLAENDWFVRHARRVLQQRAADGQLGPAVRSRLAELATSHADETRRLRGLWALHVTGGVPTALLNQLWTDPSDAVRGWAIQLGLDAEAPQREAVIARLPQLAAEDSSPAVRLYAAAALQRLPAAERWETLAALLSHGEDAQDHNLPLMIWYAAEPLAEVDPARALRLALEASGRFPQLASFMVRRVAAIGTAESLELIVVAVQRTGDSAQRERLLTAMAAGLEGRRSVAPPASWKVVSDDLNADGSPAVRTAAAGLGVLFGDAEALAAQRSLVGDSSAPVEARRQALTSLLAVHDQQLAGVLLSLLDEPSFQAEAVRGLAAYDDPRIAEALLSRYANFSLDERRAALAALTARRDGALQLLHAVGEQKVAATDLSADVIRQLSNLGDSEVERLVGETWGQVRTTPAEKKSLIGEYMRIVDAPVKAPDRELGRAVFARTCQQCHSLYGVGAKIGPDLTGSNRSDLDYLLSNVVDPNALIAKEYQTTVLQTADGRVVSGMVTKEDAQSLTVQTPTELVVIPMDEIEARQLSDASLMPEDQLKQFSPHETASLFAYLRDRSQCAMLATPETAGLLFNGRDLSLWRGDEEIWSVHEGEIVGRTRGISHNSFLVSELSVEDFRFGFEVKLVDDAGNSGVQFRSQPLDGFRELRGLQADIGPGWWGKLYEENGRALLWDKSGEAYVRRGEWNSYEIVAQGSTIRTSINGQLCADLHDEAVERRGVIALQMHSGGTTEVRFRNLKLEVLPASRPAD